MNKSIKFISITTVLVFITFISIQANDKISTKKTVSSGSAAFKDYFNSSKKQDTLSDNYWTSGKFNMSGM
ncbi:MAG: hypothetical protein U9Q33_05775 [Campylobacterota bacterium]|nr:hypothetical protein [Campylobacterota bacterium]